MTADAIAPTLVPSLPYDDVAGAIDWLVRVLGFRVGASYAGPDGRVGFAQLVWRTAVVFVSARAPAGNPWVVVGPASIALAAADAAAVDRHYARAVAAGAEIVRPLQVARTPAFPDGSRQFDVRDPGGHLWTIGTFQPRFPADVGADPV